MLVFLCVAFVQTVKSVKYTRIFLLTVFAQVVAGFRYGRDDLDVLGLSFRRDLIDVSVRLD